MTLTIMELDSSIKQHNNINILSLSLVGILLVVNTAAAAAGSANNNNSIITNQFFQIAEAQLADNNSNNAAADVSLVNQKAYSDASLFHIAGEVQNTGTEPVEYVQIIASFYNGNGQFVGTDFTYAAPTTLSPGMKAPFDMQLLIDEKIVKESKKYQLTLTWLNQDGKEMVRQYQNADLRQEEGQQQSSPSIGSGTNILSQTTEATTTTTTDVSFRAKALQFLTYCNNQFSQTSVSSMPIDTLVFCTMVYDWYYMGCNNAIITPIIAAQCRDPIIIQQVNNYKTQIDIRIKQIIVSPPPPEPCDPAENQTCAPPPPCDPNTQSCPPPPPDCEEDPTAEGCTPPPEEDEELEEEVEEEEIEEDEEKTAAEEEEVSDDDSNESEEDDGGGGDGGGESEG
jgi:hypothetical protein